ncbi:Hint domain-containing protein [Maritimibacter dapengensis]|uniref:Choice-of-anchor L domain-containing protein n=1 Tax=Maritimibacter dapengensis TaxID=2836868 RepID=A0ABS6T5Q4_9RHOB|nr:Hint domain-containing protein [Maritimibacter dapengensis]MBV7379871.1 choice-of-anchor L domain-containing protein [Maritimibacter dapengensis]
MATASELPIDAGASAMEMAETIFGAGISVESASYTGDFRSSGIYTNGDSVAPGVTPADSGVMLSTGRLTSFTNSGGDPNRSGSTSSNTSGQNNEAGFNALAGTNTYDASYLDVDIIPDGDTVSLQFVFSSEEYPEYAGSIYNDLVGIWVNGAPAELTIGDGSSSVGNLNDATNENLYVDNTGDDYNTEMDGFTVTMTVKLTVNPGEVNSIRIGIADVGDSSYDSTLLIAAESGQSVVLANDDSFDIAPGFTKVVDVISNDEAPSGSTITITHINGVEVVAGDTVNLTTGQSVTLNADGTFTVVADSDIEAVNFSYTIDADGISDSAFVTLNSIPCFVAGTRIATPTGCVPVETLRPGDLVETHDDGPRPLRWIGARQVAATGHFAPIRIRANTFGQHGELRVSPLHRILIRDAVAQLLFDEPEVLVAARDLVNDGSVRPLEGGRVTYVHLLFDRHQVVYSEGLATESFLPGPQTLASFEREMVEEICTLFPELDRETMDGYPPAARPMLKQFEARLLLSRRVAA